MFCIRANLNLRLSQRSKVTGLTCGVSAAPLPLWPGFCFGLLVFRPFLRGGFCCGPSAEWDRMWTFSRVVLVKVRPQTPQEKRGAGCCSRRCSCSCSMEEKSV